MREESVGAALALNIELLGGQADDLSGSAILIGLLHVVVAQVDLAVEV